MKTKKIEVIHGSTMPHSDMQDCNSVVVNGCLIYLVGGNQGSNSNHGEFFNVKTRKFAKIANTLKSRNYRHSMTNFHN